MSRRIEIELTSKREDGTWTWRAAGALQPKGVVNGSVVPDGVSINDTVRAEVESDLDGHRVLSISPIKTKAARTGLLDLLPSDKPFEAVTQQLRKKDARRDDKRRPRREGRDERGKGGDGEGRPQRGPRRNFEAPPELPQRPKAKRIRPGRTHIDAVLADLPEAQRAIAEKVLIGGVPAVRSAIEEQNKTAVAAGQEKIPAEGLVQMAEQLLPRLRVAEWRDRAESADKILNDIDLRDLRSIVVSASDPVIMRDESTRDLAAKMKAGLAARQESETKNWIDDIEAATNVGRVVRALKLSSQPPKAGVPFPPALAAKMAAAATAALTSDALPDRWIALLEAIAFSPVRTMVAPTVVPLQVSDELSKTVVRLAPAMPQIATLFGLTVDPKAPMPRPLRPTRPERPVKKKASDLNKGAEKAGAKGGKPSGEKVEADKPAEEVPASEAPAAESPVAEAPVEVSEATDAAPAAE
jgi:hypothetical protein